MDSANEVRRCIVTSFLIGWTHTQNDPWVSIDVVFFNYIWISEIDDWK